MDRKEEYRKLLTIPDEIRDYKKLTLSGNEYISIPEVDRAGGIDSVNVLRLDYRGLLEFRGGESNRLILPTVKINGQEINLEENTSWHYELDWIPSFKAGNSEKCIIKGEIITPPECRGFLYCLQLENCSDATIEIEAGWKGSWESFNYIVFKRREVDGKRRVNLDQWTRSLVLEGTAGLPLAALALAVDRDGSWEHDQGSCSYSFSSQSSLAPGESYEICLYAAVNLEGDGAGTTNIDLRRQGAEVLKKQAVEWLEQHRVKEMEDQFSSLFHRNLFFSYFYAVGRCLESENLVALTSRSPRYYVSAAFWSRDTLLWSFPAILMTDQARGRELLMTIFERHIDNAGDHAHYINGTLLYPGFELDQLAAYILSLSHYLEATKDYSILNEEIIYDGLTFLAEKALDRFDPEVGLYSTFLDPSDDPVFFPFLTYNNALLQRAFSFLGDLQSDGRWHYKGDFTILARELTYAIYEHCTVKGPVGTMFAWSVDGRGRFFIYDNPPGSLQLLAHYGFCSKDDSVYRNTVRWVRSKNNRYFNTGANFEEAGSIHSARSWPMGACNDLLSCNAGALDFLGRAEMDNGFFCETVYPDTGLVSTGAAFASGAGFLAYSLLNKQQESSLCSTDEQADELPPMPEGADEE